LELMVAMAEGLGAGAARGKRGIGFLGRRFFFG